MGCTFSIPINESKLATGSMRKICSTDSTNGSTRSINSKGSVDAKGAESPASVPQLAGAGAGLFAVPQIPGEGARPRASRLNKVGLAALGRPLTDKEKATFRTNMASRDHFEYGLPTEMSALSTDAFINHLPDMFKKDILKTLPSMAIYYKISTSMSGEMKNAAFKAAMVVFYQELNEEFDCHFKDGSYARHVATITLEAMEKAIEPFHRDLRRLPGGERTSTGSLVGAGAANDSDDEVPEFVTKVPALEPVQERA